MMPSACENVSIGEIRSSEWQKELANLRLIAAKSPPAERRLMLFKPREDAAKHHMRQSVLLRFAQNVLKDDSSPEQTSLDKSTSRSVKATPEAKNPTPKQTPNRSASRSVKETPKPVKETSKPVKETYKPVKETYKPVKETSKPVKVNKAKSKKVLASTPMVPHKTKEFFTPEGVNSVSFIAKNNTQENDSSVQIVNTSVNDKTYVADKNEEEESTLEPIIEELLEKSNITLRKRSTKSTQGTPLVAKRLEVEGIVERLKMKSIGTSPLSPAIRTKKAKQKKKSPEVLTIKKLARNLSAATQYSDIATEMSSYESEMLEPDEYEAKIERLFSGLQEKFITIPERKFFMQKQASAKNASRWRPSSLPDLEVDVVMTPPVVFEGHQHDKKETRGFVNKRKTTVPDQVVEQPVETEDREASFDTFLNCLSLERVSAPNTPSKIPESPANRFNKILRTREKPSQNETLPSFSSYVNVKNSPPVSLANASKQLRKNLFQEEKETAKKTFVARDLSVSLESANMKKNVKPKNAPKDKKTPAPQNKKKVQRNDTENQKITRSRSKNKDETVNNSALLEVRLEAIRKELPNKEPAKKPESKKKNKSATQSENKATATKKEAEKQKNNFQNRSEDDDESRFDALLESSIIDTSAKKTESKKKTKAATKTENKANASKTEAEKQKSYFQNRSEDYDDSRFDALLESSMLDTTLTQSVYIKKGKGNAQHDNNARFDELIATSSKEPQTKEKTSVNKKETKNTRSKSKDVADVSTTIRNRSRSSHSTIIETPFNNESNTDTQTGSSRFLNDDSNIYNLRGTIPSESANIEEVSSNAVFKKPTKPPVKRPSRATLSKVSKKPKLSSPVKRPKRQTFVDKTPDSGIVSGSEVHTGTFSGIQKQSLETNGSTINTTNMSEIRRSTRNRKPPPTKKFGTILIVTNDKELQALHKVKVNQTKTSAVSFRTRLRNTTVKITEDGSAESLNLQPTDATIEPSERNSTLRSSRSKNKTKKERVTTGRVSKRASKVTNNTVTRNQSLQSIQSIAEMPELTPSNTSEYIRKGPIISPLNLLNCQGFSMGKMYESDTTRAGVLVISPGESKPLQWTENEMMFFIQDGQVEVGYNDDIFTKKGLFLISISKGSSYYIKNLNKKNSLTIFYTRTRSGK